MNKIFSLFLCLLLTGCSGCALKTKRVTAWDPMGDPRAASVQALMRQTVQVDHVFTTVFVGEDGTPESREATLIGTGTVVARKGELTYVLTADHICSPREKMSFRETDGTSVDRPVLAERFVIWTIDMKQIEATPVYMDSKADLCDIEVEGVAGDVASIFSRDPPIGATVTHVGSPLGVLNLHRAYVQDGTYMGLWNDRDLTMHRQMYALRATHGSSGGGMFYDGRLFGVMFMVSEGFDQISIGSSGTPFLKAVVFAREAARK